MKTTIIEPSQSIILCPKRRGSNDLLLEDHWPKLVGYFVVESYDKKNRERIRYAAGTVFFVSVALGNTGTSVGYAVTCRHVIEQARSLGQCLTFIRMNSKNSPVAPDCESPLNDWICSESADVAIARFAPTPEMDSWWYRMSDVYHGQVRTGRDVFLVGMFSALSDLESVQPLIRSGKISHPGLNLSFTVKDSTPSTGKILINADGFLVEMLAWAGESGSPVLVYEEQHTVGESYLLGQSVIYNHAQPQLVGILHGHWSLPENGNANSGIAMVVPIVELEKLLMDPRVSTERDEATKKIEERRRTPPPPQPDSLGPPDTVQTTFTKEDFEAALRKASRKIAPKK